MDHKILAYSMKAEARRQDIALLDSDLTISVISCGLATWPPCCFSNSLVHSYLRGFALVIFHMKLYFLGYSHS